MSYILDALRRAQAERERGQVPGLHAQPGLGGAQRTRAARAPAARRPPWVWALVGAALVALLMTLMWLLQRGSAGVSAPGPVAASSAVTQPVAPAGLPAAADTAAPPLVVVSAVPAPKGLPTATPAAAARPAADSVAPPPAAPSAVAPAVPAAPVAKAAAPAPQPAQAPALPPPAANEAGTTPAVPALTADQRRDWPPLALGGSVWSDTPAARFVILGGQVVREGESTADGVLVERITPKAVVLRWRDQRGSLPF